MAWNAALNLVPFPEWSYVPANLALAAAVAWWGWRHGIGRAEVGLTRDRLGPGVVVGGTVALVVAAGLLVAVRVPALAPLLADERAAGLSGWGLGYAAAVRIPLGTAVAEELVFRGVLIAAFAQRLRLWHAVLASSTVFGLWHIGPTVALLEVNAVPVGPGGAALAVAGSVVATTAAGIGFWLLRRWSGSLLAPIVAHSATNSLALLAAAWSQA